MKTTCAIPSLSPLLGCGLIIIASCAAPQNASRTPVAFRGDSSLTGTICHEVNLLRQASGVRELGRHAGLDKLAANHCEYLRQNKGTFSLYGKNVSHIGSDARSVVAIRVYDMINCSENVAWTKTGPSHAATSRAILKLWQDSSKHREAMLEREWTHTGVGAVVDADGSVFATQIFATKSNSLMSAQNRFNQF